VIFADGAIPSRLKALGAVLEAYGFGLMAIVLVRSAVASFQAEGDTKTPMLISLGAVAVNVALKIVLFEPFGAVGLALATAIGAWTNLIVLVALATYRGIMMPDLTLWKTCTCVTVAAFLLSVFALLGAPVIARFSAQTTRFANELSLVLLGSGGLLVYVAVLFATLRIAGVRLQRGASGAPRTKAG